LTVLRRMAASSRLWLCVLAWLVGALLPGCASHNDFLPKPNSLFDRLARTDVSASGPQKVRQNAPPGRERSGGLDRPEIYPGEQKRQARASNRRPQVGVSQESNGYQINFAGAPLEDVVKVILGDTLGLSFTFDSRVVGDVTVSSGRALTRDELLSVLETILRSKNAAIEKSSGTYHVTPLGEAVNSSLAQVSGPQGAGPGYGITVLPLRHVSAASMMRLLDGFVSRSGSVKAEVLRNLLLIKGTAPERENLTNVAASFDVDWLKGQSAAIYPLQQATPEVVIEELKEIFKASEGDLGAETVGFRPMERLNAVLVITRTADKLRDVATWVRRLDRTNSAGVNLFVYKVENGKAKDLADVLNETFAGGASRSGRAFNSDTSVVDLRAGADASGADAGRARPADRGTGEGSERAAGRRSGPGESSRTSQSTAASGSDIRITADELTNQILIRATRSEYNRVLAVLRQLDRPPLQVIIYAVIAEVTLNDRLRYGVQVYLRSQDASGGVFKGPTLELNPSFPGLNFFLGSAASPKLMLDALSRMTSVKVVSSPSVVVLDNQSATLTVGDEVPITTQQVQSVTDSDSPIINSIRFRDTGVKLKVTPRVSSSGLVTMEVEQEISNVVPGSGAGTGTTLTPTISQRKINSTVAVYSGQTVVLGGLISETRNRNKDGLPVVEKVPVIGEALGSTNNSGSRSEIIVFIRPQVMRDAVDASLVTQEFRDRLRSFTGRELLPSEIYKRKKADKHRGGSNPRATGDRRR